MNIGNFDFEKKFLDIFDNDKELCEMFKNCLIIFPQKDYSQIISVLDKNNDLRRIQDKLRGN